MGAFDDLPPEELTHVPSKGVEFTPPPAHLFEDAWKAVDAAMVHFKPGEGAIIGVGTNTGWNTAVAFKTKTGGIEVVTWVGKEWGEKINYGAVVRKRFTLPF